MEGIGSHVITSLVTLLCSAGLWAGIDLLLGRRQQGQRLRFDLFRQDKKDETDLLRDIIENQNHRIDKQESEILRLRDSEQSCRNENSIMSGRILLLEGRDRDKSKRIYKLEARLQKLGQDGSWTERVKKHESSRQADDAEGGEGGTPDAADTAG